ncbi:MAG: thioredoxin [Saprospiraceae bacterium]|nr:MAG: thioredoxin [Saprospiraceae bacterium]
MRKISKEVLNSALTYPMYRELIEGLLSQNKTTGADHSESMLDYTRINGVRMNRLDRTTKLTETTITLLKEIQQPMIWLVITEGWCGDAAQILPVMHHIAEANPNIELKLILRDEHPEIMDAFLTKGARSIPKLIILDAHSREVLGSWGPRPAEVQKMVMDAKKKMQKISAQEEITSLNNQVKIDTQKWYISDRTQRIQSEILEAVMAVLAPALRNNTIQSLP